MVLCNVSYEATNIDKLLLGWSRELLPGAQHPFIFFRTSLATSWVFPILAKLVPIPCPIFTVRYFCLEISQKCSIFTVSAVSPQLCQDRVEQSCIVYLCFTNFRHTKQQHQRQPNRPASRHNSLTFFLFIFTRCLPEG